MEESQYEALGTQFDSFCNRISGIEQRLKELRNKDAAFKKKPKTPQYTHSAIFSHSSTYKNSPFAFSVNKPPPVQPQLTKPCSGSCLIPPTARIRLIPSSTTRIVLPSSDSSDDSDDYFSSDGNGPKIVGTEEIQKFLPSNWAQLIERHNKEVENLKFGKVDKITTDEIKLYFQSMP
ncbi:hypothetical protein TRFO_05306 [Tritrichomonas foetus]|uniref:Uncharacterized protein n=1 Tax=Tritrichomonas foetus TaxID=1144522 RepID=A0A1J4KBM4_9EUKA|nr:hypothetical protein TRFO_05306 [Tritrichomonas foetus]|eukprot:OHT07092.1 hypothetical protein TRFO_05306 [Tritrichomonas foetus]